MYKKIDQATEYLRQFVRITPACVIVLNSGLISLKNELQVPVEMDFKNIPGFIPSTAEGHESRLIYGILEGKYVLMMQGKVHYYEGLSSEDLALPYRVFANLGIKNIVFTNVAGAINESYEIGDLIMVADHISLFAPSLLIGKNYDRFGPRLVDMSNVYNAELRSKVLQAVNLKPDAPKIKSGIYAFYAGPNYETPTDIKALKLLGADMTGMSTVPEATVCHQAGINVIALSLITNRASGYSKRPLSHREIILNSRVAEAKQKSLIKTIIQIIPKD